MKGESLVEYLLKANTFGLIEIVRKIERRVKRGNRKYIYSKGEYFKIVFITFVKNKGNYTTCPCEVPKTTFSFVKLSRSRAINLDKM